MSYKLILNEIGRIGVAHEQVKSIGYGLLSQLTENIDTDQEPDYTRLYIVPGETELLQGEISYSFSIIIADRIEEDLSNQVDILNDTLEITKDIFKVLKNSFSEQYGEFSLYYEPDYGATIIPFLERFETYLGGWTINISIREKIDYNQCEIPSDTLSFPINYENINYKQMVGDFEHLATQHKQINSFGIGNESFINQDLLTNEVPMYPKLFITPNTTTLDEGEIQYQFTIRVVSRLEEDFSNQMDLLNDMMEICKDIFTVFLHSEYDSDYNVTCTPILHEYQDVLGGWEFNLNLNLPTDYNRCDIPINKFKLLKWIDVTELWNTVTRYWSEV